jgi:hypothetical protein
MLELTRTHVMEGPQSANARQEEKMAEDDEEAKDELKQIKLLEKLHDMRIADGYRFHGKSCTSAAAHA